jgi:pectinesterase
LNAKGHVLFARLVVEELRQAAPELAPVLRTEPLNAHPMARESKYHAVVSADNSGTHSTIQAAIAAAPDNGTNEFTILIKPGIYEGPFLVGKSKRRLRLVGEEARNTVLTWPYNVNERKASKAYQFNPGLVVVGDDFCAENLTLQNTSGDHGQALALRVDNDRAVFENCRILGWQDTLMVNNGRHYFTNCYIEGRVDFIYGSATAVFDQCVIHSKNGGYVTAASTPKEREFGFVFLNCKLTGDEVPWVDPADPAKAKVWAQPNAYLGRPWRPYAQVAFINCDLGDHVKPAGWHNWGNPTNELTARFAEYGSTGPGATPTARVKWARQLTDEEAKGYAVENILKGKDGWSPRRETVKATAPFSIEVPTPFRP